MSDSKKRILIVEDDNFISLYLNDKLQEHFETRVATTADAARTALADEPIDLIVLDILLPEEDGFALLQDLKTEGGPYRDIPVLILSNLDQPEDVSRGQELGAVDYLVKANLTPQEISERIADILR